MATNQEGVHAAVRALTGTARSYNEDWHALFTQDGISSGTFNERLLNWINDQLGTSYSNVNAAMNAFAVDQGFTSWSAMNTFSTSLAAALLARFGATPILHADYSEGEYFYNGTEYASEAALNTAAGGVVSGVTRTFGPYLDPTNTNLVSNGDFSSGTTGWAAVSGTGATIANVAGELELTAGGSISRFATSASVTDALGRAFRVDVTGRRGTTTANLQIDVSRNSNLGSGAGFGPISSTSATPVSGYVSGLASIIYVGARNTSGAGTGTAYFDNFSLVEAWPFAGWDEAGITVRIAGTTPASAASAVVLWQSDAESERDRVRLVYGTDNSLRLIGRIDSATDQFNLLFGTITTSTAFTVAFSCAQNAFQASNAGARVVTDASGIWPGSSTMRVGRSFTGETWTGTITSVTVFNSSLERSAVENLAGTAGIWGEGDSYMGLTYSATLADDIVTATGTNTVYTAVGSTTLQEQLARIQARPWLHERILVLWDGQHNGATSVNDQLDTYDEIADAIGHSRYVFIPPTAVTGQSAGYTAEAAAIRDGLLVRHPNNTLDYRTTLNALNDSSANDLADIAAGQLPRSIMYSPGDVHLNATAKTAMAVAIDAFIDGKGW